MLHNQNPYQIEQLFTESNAVWLPPVIGFFLWLGMFPFEVSRIFWLLITLITFFILCFTLLQPVKSPNELVWIILLVLFPSTIINFTMGQFSIMSCFVMVCVAKSYNKIPPWVNGFLFALLFSKPQLIIFSLPVFIFRLMLEKGKKKAFIQIVWIMVGLLIYSSPFLFINKDWTLQLIENLRGNSRWLQPNPFSYLVQYIGHPTLIGLFLVVISLLFLFRYSYTHSMYETIVFSMAITTILSPYIWSWDFVLLIPLLINSFKKYDLKASKMVAFIGYVAITLLFSAMKIAGYNSDEFFIWVPPSILILLLLANRIENQFSRRVMTVL